MSIPSDIRDIRRKRYEASASADTGADLRTITGTDSQTTTGTDSQTTTGTDLRTTTGTDSQTTMCNALPIVMDESLDAILARVAIYERDEKLAADMLIDDVTPPIPAVIEQLIDSFPTFTDQQRFIHERVTHSSKHNARVFWQCKQCGSINLRDSASCLFCQYIP